MKLGLVIMLAAVVASGCNTTITDKKIPKRNNAATDYANVANERHARDMVMFSHGNADRP